MTVAMLSRIRVAIVEDHKVVRQAFEHWLQSWGFDVCICAENGRAFLDALDRGVPPPDVCLLDVSMPIMDGFQTAEILRERWPSIKILSASFSNKPVVVLEMLRCGACGYLLKDGEPEEWYTAIVEAHLNGCYFSTWVSHEILEHLRRRNK